MLVQYNGPGGDVVIPDGVRGVLNSVFESRADTITSIVFPEGVTDIGGIESDYGLSIPNGTYSYGAYSSTAGVYYGLFGNKSPDALVSITLPAGSLHYIHNGAFKRAKKLETINWTQWYRSTLYEDETGAFRKDSSTNYSQFQIGQLAFANCESLKEMYFPAPCNKLVFQDGRTVIAVPTVVGEIMMIEEWAFSGCTALEKVTFGWFLGDDPKNARRVYLIFNRAFENCSNLEVVECGQNISSIAPDSFEGCNSIKSMTLPEDIGTAELAQFAETPWFQNRYGNQEFVVQDGVLIGYNGPGGEVVIPDNLGIVKIGRAGFENVTSVVIPEGVLAIEEEAFADKAVALPANLERVTLPSSLKYIGNEAFRNTKLTEVTLPENVVVGLGAFADCDDLATVTVPDSAVFLKWSMEPPFNHTPFEEELFAAQKDKEFAMLGCTLYQYHGAGGDVILPSQTKIVADGTFRNNETITSITYPKEAQTWMDQCAADIEAGISPFQDYDYSGFSNPFIGCKRLQMVINMPMMVERSDWTYYQKNIEKFKLKVDLEKCLGTPSERIIAQSNAIVSAAGAVTDYDKAKAIADWVAHNVKYDWDVFQNTKSEYDAVIDPEGILNGAATVCEGYGRLTNALLWAQGIPANFVRGFAVAEGKILINPTYYANHAWNEAWIKEEGRWVIIDTTWMAPFMNGTQTQGYEPKYFDMGIVEFSREHMILERPYTIAEPTTQAGNTAYASTQSVLVDGAPVEFQCYALKDANGNDTNYIKLRDVASILNGTAVQFEVGWDGAVNIETGKSYTPNGSEMSTPFSDDRAYEEATAPTNINGAAAALDAIVLKDDAGGAYTYYKLRDLGTALGFRVDWSAEKGIFIETK